MVARWGASSYFPDVGCQLKASEAASAADVMTASARVATARVPLRSCEAILASSSIMSKEASSNSLGLFASVQRDNLPIPVRRQRRSFPADRQADAGCTIILWKLAPAFPPTSWIMSSRYYGAMAIVPIASLSQLEAARHVGTKPGWYKQQRKVASCPVCLEEAAVKKGRRDMRLTSSNNQYTNGEEGFVSLYAGDMEFEKDETVAVPLGMRSPKVWRGGLLLHSVQQDDRAACALLPYLGSSSCGVPAYYPCRPSVTVHISSGFESLYLVKHQDHFS